jgi:hypothetical protein
VVEEDAGTRLEQVLVDKRHDGDVVLRPGRARHDGVVVVDELLEVADAHGAATHVVDTRPLVGITVDGVGVAGVGRRSAFLDSLGLADALLVLDVLLF